MEDDAGTAGGIREKASDRLPGGIETIANIHNDWMETGSLLNTKKAPKRMPRCSDMNWYFYHSTGGAKNVQPKRN